MTQLAALTDRITISGQDATLTRTFQPRAEGPAFRITARINSYEAQSSIALDRWDGARWQPVAALAGTEIVDWPVANSARIRKTFTADLIDVDIARLMVEGEFITDGFR